MEKDFGWIKLHRAIMHNKRYFSEPFTYTSAWIDLLLLANHSENIVNKRGIEILIKRGQTGYSSHALAIRWKWSRSKVERFLDSLEKDNQIEQHKTPITTITTIINYDEYQSSEPERKQKETPQDEKPESPLFVVGKELNIPFSDFWELYDKKRGDKDKLIKKWASLKASEREAIIEFIPKYKLLRPDSTYRKDPQGFFSNKVWKDEDIIKEYNLKYPPPPPASAAYNNEW
jgi:hypothetical protein